MASFTVDTANSHVTLRTRAKGLFSALAHDLELKATVARGTAKGDGDAWEGELYFEPAAIRVVGSIKGGKTSPLSKIEVDMCEKRIVSEIFEGVREVAVKARGTVNDPKIEVTAKKSTGPKLKLTMSGTVIEGRGAVSIEGLGLPEVKAPLNAFTVRDDVEVEAKIALVPA